MEDLSAQEDEKYAVSETPSEEEEQEDTGDEDADATDEDIAPTSPVSTTSLLSRLAGRGVDKIRRLVARKVTLDIINLECESSFASEPLELVLLFADFGFTYRVLVTEATGAPLLIKTASCTCTQVVEQVKKYIGPGLSSQNDVAQIVQQSVLVASKGARRYMLVPLQSQPQRRIVIDKLSRRERVAAFSLAISTRDSVSNEINAFLLKRRRSIRRKLIFALVTVIGMLLAMIWRFRDFLGIKSVPDAISRAFSFLNNSVPEPETEETSTGQRLG